MSRREFERYLAHAKAEIASGKHSSSKGAVEAARYSHAKAVEERYWVAKEKGENPNITLDDEEAGDPDKGRNTP